MRGTRARGAAGVARTAFASGAAVVILVTGGLFGGRASSAEEAPLERAHAIVRAYEERFSRVDPSLLRELDELYAPDAVLRDPITTVRGRERIRAYLRAFVEQSRGARFEVRHRVVEPGAAAVFWTMVLPGDGEAAATEEDGDGEAAATEEDGGHRVEGVSHLRFDERITRQRDYFDLGAAVYEQVPVLGWLTGLVDSLVEPDLPEPDAPPSD